MVRPKIFGRPGRKGVSMNQDKYAEFTRGQQEDLLNKMGGLDGVKRFQSGELMLVERSSKVGPDFPSFTKFDLGAFLGSWAKFYRDIHGFDLNGEDLVLPPIEQAMGAGVVMAQSVTIERDLAAIKKITKSDQLYRYTSNNIDETVQRDKEARRPAGPYVLWTAPAIEATDQTVHLAKKSYNDITEMGILPQVMTFAEYTRFFCWFLWTTGRPLDLKTITLTGSLEADGGVLDGGWCGDGFGVGWDGRGNASGSFRFRQVVLPPLS